MLIRAKFGLAICPTVSRALRAAFARNPAASVRNRSLMPQRAGGDLLFPPTGPGGSRKAIRNTFPKGPFEPSIFYEGARAGSAWVNTGPEVGRPAPRPFPAPLRGFEAFSGIQPREPTGSPKRTSRRLVLPRSTPPSRSPTGSHEKPFFHPELPTAAEISRKPSSPTAPSTLYLSRRAGQAASDHFRWTPTGRPLGRRFRGLARVFLVER